MRYRRLLPLPRFFSTAYFGGLPTRTLVGSHVRKYRLEFPCSQVGCAGLKLPALLYSSPQDVPTKISSQGNSTASFRILKFPNHLSDLRLNAAANFLALRV
jgi:hypothetical protein